jgi:hypothetical protein
MAAHPRSRRLAAVLATVALLIAGYACLQMARSIDPWALLGAATFDAATFREAAAERDDETLADQALVADWYDMRGMPMAEARRTFGPPRRTERDGRRWVWDLEIPGDYERAKVTIDFGPDRRLDSVSVHSLRTLAD